MILNATLIIFVTLLPALIYPVLAFTYRRRLWQRRTELEAMVTGKESAALYKKAFGIEPIVLFNKTFSSKAYRFPVFMNMLCAWIMTAVAFDRAGVPGVLPASFKVFTQHAAWRPVLAALLGAFIWGMYDTLRRYRSGNLSPEALHFAWLRMLIAGALGPFVSKIFAIDDPANMLTFGLGIFPVKTLNDLVQGQIVKRGNLQLTSVPSEAPTLDKLQGMTPLTIETLSEADIESCEQLAFSDPLRLSLRTNLPWKVIIDLIDQALLFAYVGEKSKDLHVLGIRGVIELSALRDEPPDDAHRETRLAILAGIAEKIGSTESGVRNLIDTV